MTPGRPTADQLPDWTPELVAHLDFPLGWRRRAGSPEEWRERGRRAFRSLLLEDDEPLEARPEVLASEKRAGYRVDRLELTLGRFRRTPALMAIPEGPGPFPALLVLHDHGACFDIGKEKMIRPLAGHPRLDQAVRWAEANYDGTFVGDEAARRGWVVLSIDAYGWGDRACAGYESQQALAANLLGLGSSWAGLIAVEDLNAARWLARHPLVDPARVASLGHSMGAFRAWQLHGLCDEVKATVGVCSFGTVAGLMVPGGNRVRGQSAFSMTHPGLARLLDFPDVAALGAPKPLYLLHGTEDGLFPVETVEEAYGKTAEVYQGFGKPENFRGEWKPGGHRFTREDQEKVWSWLNSVGGEGAFSSLLS